RRGPVRRYLRQRTPGRPAGGNPDPLPVPAGHARLQTAPGRRRPPSLDRRPAGLRRHNPRPGGAGPEALEHGRWDETASDPGPDRPPYWGAADGDRRRRSPGTGTVAVDAGPGGRRKP